jgi:hypothetical protein
VTYPQQGHQQQGGYGPGYPQPGGYGPQPPNKPKTGLIVGIVASVVVAALGLVLVLTLTGDDDDKPGTAGGGGTPPGGPGIPDPTLDYTADNAPGGPDSGPGGGDDGGGSEPGGAGDPQALAQTVARAFETHDAAAMEALGCNSGDKHYLQQDLAVVEGDEVTATAADVAQTTETLATATIKITPAGGQAVDYPIGMQLLTNETEWCVRHR